MDSQQIELIGRAHLEMRLLQSGFEVALPVRDRGIDLIAFTDVPGERFQAVPIQMKAATQTIYSVDRKYEGRGIVYAYVWHALEQPRLFLLRYEDAVSILPDSSARSRSWQEDGRWYTGRPSADIRSQLAAFEDNFDVLRKAIS